MFKKKKPNAFETLVPKAFILFTAQILPDVHRDYTLYI